MAVPASFDESNAVRDVVDLLGDTEALAVMRSATGDGQQVFVSCWKLTEYELDEVVRTGRLWLTVAGRRMPSVSVDGVRPF